MGGYSPRSVSGRFHIHIITDPEVLARIEAGNRQHAENMRDPAYVARMEAAHQRACDRHAREWADALGIDLNDDSDDGRPQ